MMPFEDDLRDALRRGAKAADPPGDAWDRMQEGPPEPSSGPRTSRIAVFAVAAVVAIAGLAIAFAAFGGDEPPVGRGVSYGDAGSGDMPLLRGGGMVVSPKGDDATYLCLGGVLESLPPQCSGPEIVGWDWDAV